MRLAKMLMPSVCSQNGRNLSTMTSSAFLPAWRSRPSCLMGRELFTFFTSLGPSPSPVWLRVLLSKVVLSLRQRKGARKSKLVETMNIRRNKSAIYPLIALCKLLDLRYPFSNSATSQALHLEKAVLDADKGDCPQSDCHLSTFKPWQAYHKTLAGESYVVKSSTFQFKLEAVQEKCDGSWSVERHWLHCVWPWTAAGPLPSEELCLSLMQATPGIRVSSKWSMSVIFRSFRWTSCTV